jgi:hypothetical protein
VVVEDEAGRAGCAVAEEGRCRGIDHHGVACHFEQELQGVKDRRVVIDDSHGATVIVGHVPPEPGPNRRREQIFIALLVHNALTQIS